MSFFGLDLGQRQDFSALAAVEEVPVTGPFDLANWRTPKQGRRLVVRYLERMRLGTPYLEVAARVAGLARHPRAAGVRRLVVDATGVGMPVVEMIRAAKPGCEVTPVLITGGGLDHHDGRVWHVPKVDLMAVLQELLEKKELQIPRKLAEAGTLVRELVDVRGRVRASGRVRVGADGSGEHDDLVIALALACWAAKKGAAGARGERLWW